MPLIKNRKLIIKMFFAIVLLSVILFFLKEFISNYFVRLNLNTIDAPGKGSRVLVFSPHNDDETLGAGELIKNTLKNGGDVKVVFITNGDGFKQAIQFDYFNINPKPEDYINFGYERQKESTEALKTLGLPRDKIIFLGYPDGGISNLWSTNWERRNSYISAHTQTSTSPYRNSFTKNAVYSGESLSEDIRKIINDFKPTHIVYPHPNDRHPDHWATNAFVKYVIASEGYTPDKEWLYLVHRGDWPTPMKREISMYLVPPAKLVNIGTSWFAFDFSKDDVLEKEKVIHLYKTQIKTLRLLMTAFERKNELFGEYNNSKLYTSQNASDAIMPNSSNQVIEDPLQDAFNLELSKGSDITGVYVEEGLNKEINIFLKVDGEMESFTRYDINIVFFNNSEISRLNLEVKDNKISAKHSSNQSILNIDGTKVSTNEKIIHVVIPKGVTGEFKNIFINATTSIEDRAMDKTAWRMLQY